MFQIAANEDDVIANSLPVNAALKCVHVSATASTSDGNDGGFVLIGGLKETAGATGTTTGNFASSTTEKGYLSFAIAPRDPIEHALSVIAKASIDGPNQLTEYEERDVDLTSKATITFAKTYLPMVDHALEVVAKTSITFLRKFRKLVQHQWEPPLERHYWPVKPPSPAMNGFGLVVNASLEFDYVRRAGTTAQRPTNRPVGWVYFDTTLVSRVVWTGSTWDTV